MDEGSISAAQQATPSFATNVAKPRKRDLKRRYERLDTEIARRADELVKKRDELIPYLFEMWGLLSKRGPNHKKKNLPKWTTWFAAFQKRTGFRESLRTVQRDFLALKEAMDEDKPACGGEQQNIDGAGSSKIGNNGDRDANQSDVAVAVSTMGRSLIKYPGPIVGSYNRRFPQYPSLMNNKGYIYGWWSLRSATHKRGKGLYGSYPNQFLNRVLALFPFADPILHAPSGSIIVPRDIGGKDVHGSRAHITFDKISESVLLLVPVLVNVLNVRLLAV